MNSQGQEDTALNQGAVAAVIVAHPDDELLWAGGTILMRRTWNWTVITLCRASDPDRSPKFAKAMDRLRAVGRMADLDDGPEQTPLAPKLVQETILSLLPEKNYDLILTHSPFGEYTRHRRHEETGRAVLDLWGAGRLSTKQLWMFAYGDGCRRHLPRPLPEAHMLFWIPVALWQQKQSLITDLYGFRSDAFEARSVSPREAFWSFDSPSAARTWLEQRKKPT